MLNLLDLPSEVLAHVASFCVGASLKSLRQTTSRMSEASTPELFRSVTIVPHAASLASLLTLSRSPLARHVHDIVYDVRVLSNIADIKRGHEVNGFSVVGTNVDASRMMVFTMLDQYEEQALISVDAAEVEIRHLLAILPSLLNLEHITMTSGSFCELPYFYRKLKESLYIDSDYYFQTSDLSGQHAHSMLLCLGALSRKLRGLSFIGIDWSKLTLFGRGQVFPPRKYVTLLHPVFRSLPRETLQLPMSSILDTGKKDDRFATESEELMGVCATVLDSIQHLTLFLATARSERQLFMPTGPGWPLSGATECAWLGWPNGCMHSIGHGPSNLQRLTLSSVVLNERDLKFFLDGCRDTLTELSIGDMRLYSENLGVPDMFYAEPEESCWVGILDMIQTRMLQLKSVRLFGRFYNGGSQDWVLDSTGEGSLKTDVERWIVKGGMCPLDSERLAGGFQGTRAGDASFNIFRRTFEDGIDDQMDYEFPPTSENELELGAW